MKNLNKIFLALAVVLSLSACKKDADIGPWPDKVQGLSGSWVLTRVVQIDFTDPANRSKDVSRFFLSEEVSENQVITFSAENNSFNVTQGVKGPNLLGEPGNWSFDDNRFPTRIIINRNNNITEWQLSSPTRPQDRVLRVTTTDECNGDVYVGYRFEFNRL